jgi:hypothetical protein
MIRGMEGKGFFRDGQDRKDFVTCLEDLSKQTPIRILAGSLLGRVWAKVIWILRREYGIAIAEIARQLGVRTSAIAKAIRRFEEPTSMKFSVLPYFRGETKGSLAAFTILSGNSTPNFSFFRPTPSFVRSPGPGGRTIPSDSKALDSL